MSNRQAIEYGRSAIRAGDPEFYGSDDMTSLTDTLANMMHWATHAGVDFHAALSTADMHHDAEIGQADETTTYPCPGCGATVHAHEMSDAATANRACEDCETRSNPNGFSADDDDAPDAEDAEYTIVETATYYVRAASEEDALAVFLENGPEVSAPVVAGDVTDRKVSAS